MELDLPGFRFHPTEEELLDFYLKRMVHGNSKLPFEIIATINLYRYNPWELPGLAKIGEREWYFYVPRDRKQANGGRPSRTTERGFWKATGCDRPVRSAADPKRLIGLKKTLVYYEGRAPRGTKTDWVMNEYRLPDPPPGSASSPSPKEDSVLCKVYRKATSMKELEQRAAAMEEEMTPTPTTVSQGSAADDVILIEDAEDENIAAALAAAAAAEEEEKEEVDASTESMADFSPGWDEQEIFQLSPTGLRVDDFDLFNDADEEVTVAAAAAPSRRPSLPELEVPRHTGLEWMQDPFLTQLRSPWMLDLWSPSYSSILNF